MSRNSEIELWTDGDCALCRRSGQWIEHRDERGAIRIRDFRQAADHELPAPRERLEAELVARDRDGRVVGGFDAWRRVLAALPGWRWLAVVTGLPPFSWLGPPLYRRVARHRHQLFRNPR